jgi:peptide/nickel transport system permease protein
VDLAYAADLFDHPAAEDAGIRRGGGNARRLEIPHSLSAKSCPTASRRIAVKTSLDCGFVILVGASLSFLGLGIQPPTPDLGTMVSQGSAFLPDYWWESILPGFAILFIALGFNLLGDGLRDLFDVQEVR